MIGWSLKRRVYAKGLPRYFLRRLTQLACKTCQILPVTFTTLSLEHFYSGDAVEMKQLIWAALVASLITGHSVAANADDAEPRHGIAMHGNLKHGPDFSHFTYVNPEAKKQGTLRLGVQGSFDSLNPLIVRGQPAAGLREYVFESLMARALDEPFSLYGHIAKSVIVPDDRSSITFILRQDARFSDGKPLA